LKWFRRIGLVVVLLAFAAGLFYWFMPAGVATSLLARRAHGFVLDDVSGTVWDGRAGRVTTIDGRELGALSWHLGRDAILGRTHLDLNLDGRAGRFQGHLERPDADHMIWTGIDFRLDVTALSGPALPPELIPVGIIEGKVPRAELQGNWPVALDADVLWRAAAVKTPEGHITLGGIALKAGSQGGILRATLDDDGQGSLAVHAALAATPLGWRLDGKLVPRIEDTALSHLIARFGPLGRDGAVNLQRKAGLAPSITTP
jgi:general secretion pathway protein N